MIRATPSISRAPSIKVLEISASPPMRPTKPIRMAKPKKMAENSPNHQSSCGSGTPRSRHRS